MDREQFLDNYFRTNLSFHFLNFFKTEFAEFSDKMFVKMIVRSLKPLV